MSELEKIKRAEYQRKRKKLIWIQMIIVGILTLATIITSTLFVTNNKNAHATYTEEGNVIYRAYLADNDFYEEEYLNGSHAYVASLINKMTADFSYDLKMQIDNVHFQYSYKIDARLIIKDKSTKTKIYDSIHEILYEETAQVSGTVLNIRKLVEFDYQKFNKKANDFNTAYNLKNTENILLVKMDIVVIGMSESFLTDNQDLYTISLNIPLMQSVISPSVSTTVPTGEQKIIVKDVSSYNNLKIFAIVFGCSDLLTIIILLLYIFFSIDKHIDYARKVKKLLSNYDSYIQKILNPFNFSAYQLLHVNSFKALLEIRDTIQSPILTYENDDKTHSQFFIATAYKVLYMFEITVEENEIKHIYEETNVNNEEVAVTAIPDIKIDNIITPMPIEKQDDVTHVTYRKSYSVPKIKIDNIITPIPIEKQDDVTYVTYRKSYSARLIQSDDEFKDKYCIIKRELLSFNKVKARTSWSAETFSIGRVKCAKFTIRGKCLWLNLKLLPSNYVNSKYFIVDCSDKKKFTEVPVALKIRSRRSIKFAMELINDMMNELNITRTDKQLEVTALPYEDTKTLIQNGYIKEIYSGNKNKDTSVIKLNVGKMLRIKSEEKN